MGSAGRVMHISVQATDLIIRWSTATVVIGVAGVAAYVSYQHAWELVAAHGESGPTSRLVPLTVDGLVYASSMALLDAARHERTTPWLARSLLGLGITATLAANVAHGLGNGLMGALVAAWPAVALVGSYELLMSLIRAGAHRSTDQDATADTPNSLDSVNPEPATDAPNDLTEIREGEYEENKQNADANKTEAEFETACSIADVYWRKHQRWVRRDELRTEMHCSTKRATELLREMKHATEGTTPIASKDSRPMP